MKTTNPSGISDKAWNWIAVFFVVLFIVFLAVPARSAEIREVEDLVILDHYPIEYCAAVLDVSTTILAGETDDASELLELKHSMSLHWFLTVESIDADVIDLIGYKLEELLEKGTLTAKQMVSAGNECQTAHLAYLRQE